MKLIKNLFKKNKSRAASKEHKTRAHRIKLAPIEEVYFSLKLNGSPLRCRVANLSTSGIGLLTENELESGKTISGTLHLKEKEIPLKINTIFVSTGICGAHFVECPEEFKNEILNHFKMQYLGSLMCKVNPAYLQKNEDGEVHWFVDGARNELHYVVDKDGIINYHMTFLKNYLQGGRNLPVRTGRINHSKNKDMMVKASHSIDFDEQPNSKIIEEAQTILRHLNQGNELEINELLKYLESPNSSNKAS
jgi:hypothetical protein